MEDKKEIKTKSFRKYIKKRLTDSQIAEIEREVDKEIRRWHVTDDEINRLIDEFLPALEKLAKE